MLTVTVLEVIFIFSSSVQHVRQLLSLKKKKKEEEEKEEINCEFKKWATMQFFKFIK